MIFVVLFAGLLVCLFGYTAGKVWLVITVLAVVLLAIERRPKKLLAVGGALVAAVAVYETFSVGQYRWYGLDAYLLPIDHQPLARLSLENVKGVLSVFWRPAAMTTSQSLSFSMHMPPWVLAVVALGALQAIARQRWLMAVFCVSLLPAILGPAGASTHRLLPTAALLPLLVAFAVDAVPGRLLHTGLSIGLAGAIVAWGATAYFDRGSWQHSDVRAFCAVNCKLSEYAGGPLPQTNMELSETCNPG